MCMEPESTSTFLIAPQPPKRFWHWISLSLVVIALVTITAGWFLARLNQAPSTFPVGTPITISPGTSVKAITEELAAAGVVRSATWLYVLLSWSHDPTNIKASTYIFPEPLTTDAVAKRLTEGDYLSTLIRVTHIEGERVRQLAERVGNELPNFDTNAFIALAEPYEGTLFPDTYLVPPTFTAEDVFTLLRNAYDEQLTVLRPIIATQPLSETDVIILASIVEREANELESKRTVAGILLSRLAIGMPLQADASIEYVLDKPLSQLTPEDLKRDTPYNTYLNQGLPPTPIGNPGLDAINAVLDPIDSPYLFYITGNDGTFYYAETYSEHQRNIERYLR